MSSKILVVDDQPINAQLLKRKLEGEGMTVLTAFSGHEALELVAADRPDLILLDVMMPDMDGIEVCQRLQADPETKIIPIIFITARASEGKLEGLGMGAVDYITKPIDLDETLARVQTQLRSAQMHRELIELQRRLGESRRTATLGAVTQGIAHNLNNLLGVVIGYVDLIKAYNEKPELVRKNAQQLENAVNRIVAIIKQFTNLVAKNKPELEHMHLPGLLESAVRRYQNDSRIEQPVTTENAAGDIFLETNAELFEDSLAKLLINAWESYGDAPDEQRTIALSTEIAEKDDGRHLLVHVDDSGRGLDAEMRDHAFEPFISSKHTVGVGMGLTVARHAMRSVGGEVSLAPREGKGTRATLRFPLDRKGKASAA
jgi:two-component system, sensor histidine kinase and response regulator